MAEQPKVITVPVQWAKVEFPKSHANCGKFTLISTQEIMGKTERDVFRHLVDDDSVGHMLYVPNGADPGSVQLPKEPAYSESKKPSQRLRGVFFVSWQKNTDQTEDFDAYYRRRMERLIAHVKQELED